MSGGETITAAQRARRAVIYLRQSSEGQVRHNRESQQLQYALEHRARALGFPRVAVFDGDLGASGTGDHRDTRRFNSATSRSSLAIRVSWP